MFRLLHEAIVRDKQKLYRKQATYIENSYVFMFKKKSKSIARFRQQSLQKYSRDWLSSFCLFTHNNKTPNPKIYEVKFHILHVFTESSRTCPRIFTLLGLLETQREGKTVLRKGGSCLLLHTVQHPCRLESASKAGWEIYIYHRYSNWRKERRINFFEKWDAKEVL